MIPRILVTAAAALLGLYAFWGNILGAGHFLNPFGFMFLILAAAIWVGWEPLREGFTSAKNESELPISRLGAKIVSGMVSLARGERPPRFPSN